MGKFSSRDTSGSDLKAWVLSKKLGKKSGHSLNLGWDGRVSPLLRNPGSNKPSPRDFLGLLTPTPFETGSYVAQEDLKSAMGMKPALTSCLYCPSAGITGVWALAVTPTSPTHTPFAHEDE